MNDRDKLYEILKAAEAVLKSGKYENIIDNLRKTIELLDLKDSSAYCNRGYIYLQMNQYQKAPMTITKPSSLTRITYRLPQSGIYL